MIRQMTKLKATSTFLIFLLLGNKIVDCHTKIESVRQLRARAQARVVQEEVKHGDCSPFIVRLHEFAKDFIQSTAKSYQGRVKELVGVALHTCTRLVHHWRSNDNSHPRRLGNMDIESGIPWDAQSQKSKVSSLWKHKGKDEALAPRNPFVRWSNAIKKAHSRGNTTVSAEHLQKVEKWKPAQSKSRDAIKALQRAICLSLIFMICEIVGGALANSLAVITDAAHLLSDVGGFIVSALSIHLRNKAATSDATFGYQQAEILGALGSVAIIWLMTGMLFIEAVQRVVKPQSVNGKLMFVISSIGLVINFALMKVLGHGHSHGGHGHSHGGHGHSHASAHSHARGHSHSGGHSHSHSHSGHGNSGSQSLIQSPFGHSHGSDEHSEGQSPRQSPRHSPAQSPIMTPILSPVHKRGHGHQHEMGDGHAHSKGHGEISLIRKNDQGHGHDEGHSHAHGEEHDRSKQVSKIVTKSHGSIDGHLHGAGHGHEHGEEHGASSQVSKTEAEAENLAMRAAFIHVIGDMVQSAGVMVASLLIWLQPF